MTGEIVEIECYGQAHNDSAPVVGEHRLNGDNSRERFSFSTQIEPWRRWAPGQGKGHTDSHP